MSEFSTHAQLNGDQTRNADWSQDEFLAVVSHELRNPTWVILGWTDIIISTASGLVRGSNGYWSVLIRRHPFDPYANLAWQNLSRRKQAWIKFQNYERNARTLIHCEKIHTNHKS